MSEKPFGRTVRPIGRTVRPNGRAVRPNGFSDTHRRSEEASGNARSVLEAWTWLPTKHSEFMKPIMEGYFQHIFRTSNSRLLLKHGSIWIATLPKQVADDSHDSRHFMLLTSETNWKCLVMAQSIFHFCQNFNELHENRP